MEDLNEIDIDPYIRPRASKREKANLASQNRCTTLVCVLENPKFVSNLGTVVRNIDCINISKLYVIGNLHANAPELNQLSVGANNHVYIRYFETTEECIEHLNNTNFKSIATTPHTTNIMEKLDFTCYKKLAIWFGNESHGLSDTAMKHCMDSFKLTMYGLTESFNLAVSTGIILRYIAMQRREYHDLA